MRKIKTTSTDQSTPSQVASVINRTALTAAIEKQREQLFQVQAIAGALGVAIQEGYDALDLELVTRAIIRMLDDAIEALEPAVLFGRVVSNSGSSRQRPASAPSGTLSTR